MARKRMKKVGGKKKARKGLAHHIAAHRKVKGAKKATKRARKRTKKG